MRKQLLLDGMPPARDRRRGVYSAKEYRVQCLRECPITLPAALMDTPEKAVEYWHAHIASQPRHNTEVESFYVLLVNTRRMIKGHSLVATGTLDTILVHPREVFRLAVIASCAALVMMHNHPSGDPTPSEADIKITRDLIRAGQLLKVEVLDHIVVGDARICNSGSPGKGYTSLRELGYFYS